MRRSRRNIEKKGGALVGQSVPVSCFSTVRPASGGRCRFRPQTVTRVTEAHTRSRSRPRRRVTRREPQTSEPRFEARAAARDVPKRASNEPRNETAQRNARLTDAHCFSARARRDNCHTSFSFGLSDDVKDDRALPHIPSRGSTETRNRGHTGRSSPCVPSPRPRRRRRPRASSPARPARPPDRRSAPARAVSTGARVRCPFPPRPPRSTPTSPPPRAASGRATACTSTRGARPRPSPRSSCPRVQGVGPGFGGLAEPVRHVRDARGGHLRARAALHPHRGVRGGL